MYNKRIIELRDNKNIKQYEIANILNIYSGTYNQYETEYTIIPLKHLIKICDYFKVSLDYIFTFTNTKKYNGLGTDYTKNLVGIRLKEFRKENKITQIKLAAVLNTTHSVIADI